MKIEKYEEVIEYILKSLNIYDKIKYKTEVLECKNRLYVCYSKIGREDEVNKILPEILHI